jgi:two-component system NarL family sensor kinase
MKYILGVFIVTALFTAPAFAQDAGERAKLFAALKQTKPDSARVLALINVGYDIADRNPDSAIIYYNQAYTLAKKINYIKGIFKYYACYGNILSMRGNFEQALDVSMKQVALAEYSKDTRLIGAAYNNIAGSYTDLGNIDKALEYYLKAISIYEQRNDHKHLAAVYSNLLGIFSSVGHLPARALKYGLKAIEISRANNDTGVLQEALLNVTYVYIKLNKLKEATGTITEVIAISRQLGDKVFLTDELIAYSKILSIQGKYSVLKTKADEIRSLSTQIGNKNGLAHARYFLAQYYLGQKDNKQAAAYANQSLALAKAGDIVELKISLYSLLSDIAMASGNMEAYKNYRLQSDTLGERFHSDITIKNLQEFEAKYNLGKKEAQIINLNNQKQIQTLTLQRRQFYIIALFILVLILLGVGWLISKNNDRKHMLLLSEKELREQHIQTLQKEKELMSTQSLLQGQEGERSRLAKDLHDGLGGILTGTKYSLSNMKQNMIITAENAAAFEKTMNMLDQSITELRRVAHNMMPESLLKLSLNDALEEYCTQITNSGALKITYQSFDMEDMTATGTVNTAVYRVVQELINNVVKHANAKSAMVQVTYKEDVLGITVEDDGKGIDMQGLAMAEGMGYRNIKSRIDFLKGNIDIQSARGKGTSVLIKIPLT